MVPCTVMQEMSFDSCFRQEEEIKRRLHFIVEENPIKFHINGDERNIGFSYGIVAFEEKNGNVAELVKEADRRMYLCKKRNHESILKEAKTK